MKEREENSHLRNLNEGNLHSFKWLYRFYYEKVYYFCLSITKSPLDAEEITSDVFVKVWEKRADINPSLSLSPLLMKITRDLTWNYLKRASRNKRLKEIFFKNYYRLARFDSENEIIFREYLDFIDQALVKLTPQQQRVFTLRYLKGKNLNQIAQELKISKNTVKVHLANAKRSVLDYLRIHTDVSLAAGLFILFLL